MSVYETISIGEVKLIQGEGVLRTCGLGSCVCVVLYDHKECIAGMVHIMLPDSRLARKGKFNPWRYADTALAQLEKDLRQSGAKQVKAKLAGGARMFRYAMKQEFMQVGARNVSAIKSWLTDRNIHIVAMDVGGTQGRTVEFHLPANDMVIRTVHQKETVI